MCSLIWLSKIAYMLQKKNQNNKQLKVWNHIGKIDEKHNLIPERSIYKLGQSIMPIWFDINTRCNNENNLRRCYFDDYQLNYLKMTETTPINLSDNDVSTNDDAENEKQKHMEEINCQYIVGSKTSNNIVTAIVNYESSMTANHNIHLKSSVSTDNDTEEQLGIFDSSVVTNNDSKEKTASVNNECNVDVHDKTQQESKIVHFESMDGTSSGIMEYTAISLLQSSVHRNNHKKDTATDRSGVFVDNKTTLEPEKEHVKSNVDNDNNGSHEDQELQFSVDATDDTKQYSNAMSLVQPIVGPNEEKQDTSNVNVQYSIGADNKNKENAWNLAAIKYTLLYKIPLILLDASVFIGRNIGNVFP